MKGAAKSETQPCITPCPPPGGALVLNTCPFPFLSFSHPEHPCDTRYMIAPWQTWKTSKDRLTCDPGRVLGDFSRSCLQKLLWCGMPETFFSFFRRVIAEATRGASRELGGPSCDKNCHHPHPNQLPGTSPLALGDPSRAWPTEQTYRAKPNMPVLSSCCFAAHLLP